MRVMGFRRLQHDPEAGRAVFSIRALGWVVVDMQIGTMHEYDIAHGLVSSLISRECGRDGAVVPECPTKCPPAKSQTRGSTKHDRPALLAHSQREVGHHP